MKALVLEGCTGLLGQALRHVLLGRGWSVESLERSDGDILDADFLQARLDSCAPDVVFSSLGWNTVDDAEDHPDEVLLYNRTLPHTLACLLKTRGEGHLVHFSSGLVFSGQHGSPWREEDATAPLNVYGKTRLAGEQAVLQTLPERAFCPETEEEQVICYVDKYYSKSKPEREKTPEQVIASLQKFGPTVVDTFTRWYEKYGWQPLSSQNLSES